MELRDLGSLYLGQSGTELCGALDAKQQQRLPLFDARLSERQAVMRHAQSPASFDSGLSSSRYVTSLLHSGTAGCNMWLSAWTCQTCQV